jgi:hypothetical protein
METTFDVSDPKIKIKKLGRRSFFIFGFFFAYLFLFSIKNRPQEKKKNGPGKARIRKK